MGECVYDETTRRCSAIQQQLQKVLSDAAVAATSEEQRAASVAVEEVAQEGHAAAMKADPESTSFIDSIIAGGITGAVGNVIKIGILVAAASWFPQLLTYLKQENVVSESANGDITLSYFVVNYCLVGDSQQSLKGGELAFNFEELPDVPEINLEVEFGFEPPLENPADKVDFTKSVPEKVNERVFGTKMVDRLDAVIRRAFKILEGLTPNLESLANVINTVFANVTQFFKNLGFTVIPSLRSLWAKLTQKNEPSVEGGFWGANAAGVVMGNPPGGAFSMYSGVSMTGIVLVLVEMTGIRPFVLLQAGTVFIVAQALIGSFLFDFVRFLFDKFYKALQERGAVEEVPADEFAGWNKLWNVGALAVRKVVGTMIGTVTFTLKTLATVLWGSIKAVASLFPWLAGMFGINLSRFFTEGAEKQITLATETVNKEKEYEADSRAHEGNAFEALAAVSQQKTQEDDEEIAVAAPTILVSNAANALKANKDKLWRMLEAAVAIKGPLTLTYHTKGKRAVCVIGEYHRNPELMYGPSTTPALDVDNFLLLWLQKTGVFVDLFLEAQGTEFRRAATLYIDRLRQKFSPCYVGTREKCATSRTARVHAVDPPSERNQLDKLDATKPNTIIKFYERYSPTLASVLRGSEVPDALQLTVCDEFVKKYMADLLTPRERVSQGGLSKRTFKTAEYLKNLDPQFSKTFNATLMTTATTVANQVSINLVTALSTTDWAPVFYNNAFVLINFYMDAYMLARMFKPFSVTNPTQPEYAYNSIVYAGDSHSNACRAMLRALGFAESISLKSPACATADQEECKRAEQNMTLLLTPEQSKVLLTFYKPQ